MDFIGRKIKREEKTICLGCEIKFILHSDGEHGFEAFNEGNETYKITEQAIEFTGK